MNKFLVIESDVKNIDKVRIFISSVFCECGLDLIHFNRVFIGISEAVTNSIIHGNQLIRSKLVFLEVCCKSGCLVVNIKDQGAGFDFNRAYDPTSKGNIKKEGGRGIFILKNLADEVVYSGDGTGLKIVYKIR